MKQQYKVTFGDVKIGKKITIAVEIKGSLSDEQKLALLEFAHTDGFVQLATAQRDIDDLAVKTGVDHGWTPSQHKGLGYTVENGVANVDSNQLDIDEVIKEEMIEAIEKEEQGEEMEREIEEDPIPDSLDDGDEVEQVNVEVIKGFTYLSKKAKKGDVLQMPKDTAEGLADYVKILTLSGSELPF